VQRHPPKLYLMLLRSLYAMPGHALHGDLKYVEESDFSRGRVHDSLFGHAMERMWSVFFTAAARRRTTDAWTDLMADEQRRITVTKEKRLVSSHQHVILTGEASTESSDFLVASHQSSRCNPRQISFFGTGLTSFLLRVHNSVESSSW